MKAYKTCTLAHLHSLIVWRKLLLIYYQLCVSRAKQKSGDTEVRRPFQPKKKK